MIPRTPTRWPRTTAQAFAWSNAWKVDDVKLLIDLPREAGPVVWPSLCVGLVIVAALLIRVVG